MTIAQRPRGPARGSVGAVVGSFKSAVARRINALRGTPDVPVWQRGYYERVLRDEDELNDTRRYIADNPAQWDTDAENPATAHTVSPSA
jgi:putative transposase